MWQYCLKDVKLTKRHHSPVTREMETRAQRGREMSSSTNMRQEIRGRRITEGEASLPARVRGKIEVTEKKAKAK